MQTNKFDIWVQNSMIRILPNCKPKTKKKEIEITTAGNEVACFQVGVKGLSEKLRDLKVEFNVEVGDIISKEGDVIPNSSVEVLYTEYVPVHWNSAGNPPEELEGEAPGFFPDPLMPSLWRGRWNKEKFSDTLGVWVRIFINPDITPGKYVGKIAVSLGEEKKDVKFVIEVLPFSLPKKSHLLMTNWFRTGPVINFHNLEPFTEEFWKVIEIYAKNLASHRQNVVLTPLFSIGTTCYKDNIKNEKSLIDIVEKSSGKYSFTFDNFDKWVEIFFSHGFELIEGSHLARRSTNPTAVLLLRVGKSKKEQLIFPSTLDEGYRNFLKQFLSALEKHLIEKGWLEKFCLHVSDEPTGSQFEPYTSFVKFIKNVAPGIKTMDAMGEEKFAPYVDYPVPQESKYESFAEKSGISKDQIWFYYCCEPTGPWPNRFIDLPLIRLRIFTWLAFKYNIKGFLHWGLNHWDWHPPYYREDPYNPYDNTTGGSLQAGDSFVIYPPRMPSQSHEPVDSIRWEIIRKAMEDYEYLYLLRDLMQKGKGSEKDREEGKSLMKEFNEKIVPDFTGHTRDVKYLEDFRLRVGKTIVKLNQST
ncbi:DUF4091 domain-containing protein [bacterium]|nr:DUF4091 domain-containing protein [bacterium]